MKFIKFILLFLTTGLSTSAQKKVISPESILSWPSLSGEKLSSDGKYLMYQVTTHGKESSSLILQSTFPGKREILGNAAFYKFIDDDRHLIYQIGSKLILKNLVLNIFIRIGVSRMFY